MESLEPDLLMDAALLEPSISLPLPLPHHAPHSDSMHLPNGSLDHHLLDPLHDLSGGDEDYKRMLQMLVPPTLPTSSCAPRARPPAPQKMPDGSKLMWHAEYYPPHLPVHS